MGIYDETVGARSREKELVDIGLTGQDDLRVGFGERFASANALAFGRYTPYGRDMAFNEAYDKRDKILMDAGLTTEALVTTQRVLNRQRSGNYPSLKSNYLGRGEDFNSFGDELSAQIQGEQYLRDKEQNDELLLDLINAHPELDIQSDEQIASDILMNQLELLETDEDLAERGNFLGKVGFLTGSMVGWLRDPGHAASALAGISPVGRLSMATNFLRVGASEASIIAALELIEKPGEVAFRRQFGEPDLTTAEALTESVVNIGTGGVVGGGVGALIGRATRPKRPIPKSFTGNNAVTESTQELVDKVRASQAKGVVFDPEIEQAADLLEEMLLIARNAPDDVSYETHLNKYSEARRAISEGTDVPGPDDLKGIIKSSNEEVTAPPQSETSIPSPDTLIQDRGIGDLRARLERSDVTSTRTLETGENVTVSSRETLAALDAEDAAVRATIDCLG